MRRVYLLLLVSALASAARTQGQAAPAGAARSSTSRFFATFLVNNSALTVEGDKTAEVGNGVTLGIGYGFTSRFALFVEGVGATIHGGGESYVLSHFDVGARYHFTRSERAFVPYVEGALSERMASITDMTVQDSNGATYLGDMDVSGTGFTIGGGVLYFMNPKWALNANLKWTTGEFSTVKFGSISISGLEMDARSTRMNLGLSWFPRG
jgi:hypothetical protein